MVRSKGDRHFFQSDDALPTGRLKVHPLTSALEAGIDLPELVAGAGATWFYHVAFVALDVRDGET